MSVCACVSSLFVLHSNPMGKRKDTTVENTAYLSVQMIKQLGNSGLAVDTDFPDLLNSDIQCWAIWTQSIAWFDCIT